MKLSETIACVRGDVFTTKLVTAGPREPLTSIAKSMSERNVGAVVIVDDDKPIGIVTDRDLALAVCDQGISPETPVESVMSTPVLTIPEGAGIFAATQCMRDGAVRRLPIVDQKGHLTGMISLDDLTRLLGRELFNLAEGVRHEMEIKKPRRTVPV
jgi:CBS domain-containing protein